MRGIRIEPSSVTIHDYADELETLKNEVGGAIDMITLPDGGVMIVDRDFVLKGYPLNENASAVAGFAIGGIALIFGRDGDRLADVPSWYLPLLELGE